jgi:hypothetical protein
VLVVAAIGAFVLATGGGDSESPREECERIAQSLAADLRNVTGPQADYGKLSEESLSDRCGPAAPALEKAIDFANAASGGMRISRTPSRL